VPHSLLGHWGDHVESRQSAPKLALVPGRVDAQQRVNRMIPSLLGYLGLQLGVLFGIRFHLLLNF
jgi:hypothetical protein